jgi:hypothetical protein
VKTTLIAIMCALIIVIGAGAALLQTTSFENKSCFREGYTAQIEKTGKTYCCNINEDERIINCTNKDTSA